MQGDGPRAPSFPNVRDLLVPDRPAIDFPGFGDAAFALLDRLEAEPHIGTYRLIKEELAAHVMQPFRRYRDDLAVNFVLTNRLDLETERNVFSRFLKNDFGAGGCHSHLWMSFYRSDRSRMTDLQLAHSLGPNGLTIGLFAAPRMVEAFHAARHWMSEAGPHSPLLKLLKQEGFEIRAEDAKRRAMDPLADFHTLWIRRLIKRPDVVASGGQIVVQALGAMRQLWPVYQGMLFGSVPRGE
jgi:hypothetical protein